MSITLEFLFTYYHCYLYLLAAGLGSALFTMMFHRRLCSNRSTFSRSLLLFLIIASDCIVALTIKHHFDVGFDSSHQVIINLLSRCIFAFVIAGSLVFVIDLLLSVANSLRTRVYDDTLIGVLSFFYLLIGLALYPAYQIEEWGAVWYATDYSMGIGSRFFIGSVIKFFYGDFLSSDIAVMFCLCTCLIIIVLVSFLVFEFFKTCDKGYKLAFAFLWALFLVSPGSVTSMWQKGNFGKLETYCFLISIICLLIYIRFKLTVVTIIPITILSCVSMAIYQGNIFMYYSIVLMILIWEITRNPLNIKVWGLCITNFLLTSISFIYFQFFSFCNFSSAADMTIALEQKTDLPISEVALDLELFKPMTVAFNTLNEQFLLLRFPRERAFFTFILLAPIVVIFIGLYHKYFYSLSVTKNSILKSTGFYFILLLVIIFPQFLLNTDWGRWMICEIVVLFWGFLFLVWKKDRAAINALSSLDRWIRKHWVLSIFTLVYVAGLERLDYFYFIRQATSIVQWMIHNQWFTVN